MAWAAVGTGYLGGVLNLLQQDPHSMLPALRQKAESLALDPARIEQLIEARRQARKHKDFTKADAIRQQLAEAGVLLEDTPQGTTWRVKSETSLEKFGNQSGRWIETMPRVLVPKSSCLGPTPSRQAPLGRF